jgi:hypothetical protein
VTYDCILNYGAAKFQRPSPQSSSARQLSAS